MWQHQYLLIVLEKMKKKNERDIEKLSKLYPNAEFHIDNIGEFEE